MDSYSDWLKTVKDPVHPLDRALQYDADKRSEAPGLLSALAFTQGMFRGIPPLYPIAEAMSSVRGPTYAARLELENPKAYYSGLGLGAAPALALGPVGLGWLGYLGLTDPKFQRFYNEGKREFENALASDKQPTLADVLANPLAP